VSRWLYEQPQSHKRLSVFLRFFAGSPMDGDTMTDLQFISPSYTSSQIELLVTASPQRPFGGQMFCMSTSTLKVIKDELCLCSTCETSPQSHQFSYCTCSGPVPRNSGTLSCIASYRCDVVKLSQGLSSLRQRQAGFVRLSLCTESGQETDLTLSC
jgi:hypothetical protein